MSAEKSKPRLLLSIYSYYPFADANTNAFAPLIYGILNDFSVDIVACNQDMRTNLYTTHESPAVYWYLPETGFKSKLCFWRYTVIKHTSGRNNYIVHRIKKALSGIILFFFPCQDERLLKRLIAHNDYSAIISVTSPIITQRPLLELSKKGYLKKKKIKWFPVFQDPYAFYLGFKDISSYLLKFEEQVYKRADLVFVTPEQFECYKKSALSIYCAKMRLLNISNLILSNCDENHKDKSFFKNYGIHCVYTGSLQDIMIRNPEFAFRVIRETRGNVFFHFIVSTWDSKCRRLRDLLLKDLPHVRFYDRIPLDEAKLYISHADILINIGNNAINQVPSKVLDYVGTGKPIVNFHSIVSDTSKKLLAQYPIVLNLSEKAYSVQDASNKLIDFCKQNFNKRVGVDRIYDLYKEYDAKENAKKFMAELSIEI